ncbi:MAG: domain S-box [Parcubacteria group bacterium]|nr:domain S-box [Parcubacteria group bacterium]
MRLRALLALQLFFAFLALSIFITGTGFFFWQQFGSSIQTTVSIANTNVPVTDIIVGYDSILFLLTALVFILVYLVLNRMVIKPIKVITKTMEVFATSQILTPFPPLSLTSIEIKKLAAVFVEFTNKVEQVHERDTEMSRVKSDFISTAAHQLRTPLTGIRWALEALEKEPINEFQKSLVDDAVNKSRDLVGIVGMLLDISSIESGKHKYVFEALQLQEVVENVAHDFERQAAESKVILTFIPSETLLPLVRADRQQIKWVLNNLIENGIRYTPVGGIVHISMAQVPGRVQVLVRDTGIGITPKDRNNIFERFYRAENAVAKENKGNGLGLYIARTIATDHGGDLNFSANENGPGTTFTLSLPVQG